MKPSGPWRGLLVTSSHGATPLFSTLRELEEDVNQLHDAFVSLSHRVHDNERGLSELSWLQGMRDRVGHSREAVRVSLRGRRGFKK